MAVMRLDWAGFYYSNLCNPRKRLLMHSGESLILERLLAYLREGGLVQTSGRQCTDATHILGVVKQISSDLRCPPEVIQLARSWLEQYHDVNEPERNTAARQGEGKVHP